MKCVWKTQMPVKSTTFDITMDGPTKREKKRESAAKHKDYSIYSKKAVRAKISCHADVKVVPSKTK